MGGRQSLYKTRFRKVKSGSDYIYSMYIDASGDCHLTTRCRKTVESSTNIVYHSCDQGSGDSGGPIVARDTGVLLGVVQGHFQTPPPPSISSSLSSGLIQTSGPREVNMATTLNEAMAEINKSYIQNNVVE